MKDIGILLKETRQSKGMQIKDASDFLKIRSQYLEMIENNNHEHIPPQIYLNGILKSYSKWLEIDYNIISQKLKSDDEQLSVKHSITSKPQFLNNNFTIQSPNKQTILISIFLSVLIYSIYKTTTTYTPPNQHPILPAPYTQNQPTLAPQNTPGFPHITDHDAHNYLLMANARATITLTNLKGQTTSLTLNANDVYFLPQNQDLIVQSNTPHAVDIYINDSDNTYIGNLEYTTIN